MNFYFTLRSLYEAAAENMCKECGDFIKEGSKILDLGCGSGIIGKKFQDYFKSEIIGIDIKDKRLEKIPFQLFDGELIPFPEIFFDVVLINFVLHHARSPAELLKEAKRVAKKIIIYEDLPEGVFSQLFCFLHGVSFDKFWGNPNKTVFYNKSQWKNVFAEIGLNLVFEKKIKNFPVKKELFVLESMGA